MADEVNQHAFDGGDTSPETKKEIQARNEALQSHVDDVRKISEKLEKAKQEAYDSAVEAEKKVATSTQALVTGAAVGEPGMPTASVVDAKAKSKQSKE